MRAETRSDIWRHGIFPGAAAGIAGGIVFGLTWIEFGTLASVSSIFRVSSPPLGFAIHMLISIIFGIGFGMLVWHQRPGTGETMIWGLTYGAFLWFLGALTLFPIFRGLPPSWSIETAQAQFPALLGHLLYGTAAGLAIVFLNYGRQAAGGALSITWGALARGLAAGLLAAYLCGLALGAQDAFSSFSEAMGPTPPLTGWALLLALGGFAGITFAALYPKPVDRIGTGIIHGVAFGFLFWVVVVETLLPLTSHGKLGWDVQSARASFVLFPASLFLGGLLATFYKIFDKLIELAFAEDVGRWDDEGYGTQSVRAIYRGAAGGLVGGILFTFVMWQIGALPIVAELVGSDSVAVGIVVHLCISMVIGLSYGILFQRQSHDFGAALGWGVADGFCWWILGWLTLLPIFLGGAPIWYAVSVSQTIPALAGHLIYGAGLGLTFFWLESRSDPWWLSPAQAERDKLAALRDSVLSSAPALWSLVALIALTIPVLLVTTGPPAGDSEPNPYETPDEPSVYSLLQPGAVDRIVEARGEETVEALIQQVWKLDRHVVRTTLDEQELGTGNPLGHPSSD